MLNFLKRLGRTIGDLVTSKKAIATAIGAIATAAGQPAVGAVLTGFVLAQGAVDHAKEKNKLHTDEELAAALARVKADRAAAAGR